MFKGIDCDTGLRIGELSRITGVKPGTIRFYEKCGFIEPAKRLNNQYRSFCARHIYQVRICRMVFGGFINKRLRKISMGILAASQSWDLDAYDRATKDYLQAVDADIANTERAIATVTEKLQYTSRIQPEQEADGSLSTQEAVTYSKKQAAELLGVTPESIRNWERNGLLGEVEVYRRRFYSQWAIERMYVIRLLLDNGYSMMAIKSFFAEMDAEGEAQAGEVLTHPGERDNLIYSADRYLETLLKERENAKELCYLLNKMRSLRSKEN